jgi:uncharacterized membrane-anchored protein YjiN (DUF445 family)
VVYAPIGLRTDGPREMKRVATGLLLAMAILFFFAKLLEEFHPAVGYIKAFAEAGMVGGMADWFAVTALFRHPLGVPIPHTAIIPRNKDRIGDTLAQFLRDYFLTPSVVARRMQRIDLAGSVGRFLSEPGRGSGASGRLREGASRLLADILQSLDDDRLGAMAKRAIAERLRGVNFAPIVGQALEAAMKEGRHIPLQNGLLLRARDLLADNEALIRAMVHERSGRLLRWTGLDEDVADAIISGLNKLFADLADDPAHPLRDRINQGFAELAINLQRDSDVQMRVARLRDDIIENPAMQRWISGLWEQGREALLKAARDPNRAMAGKLGDMVREMGASLQKDAPLKALINRFARRTAAGVSASYGHSIVKLISETVRGWDTALLTDRIEGTVGRDLQYIRINGTLVGGLVGLVIHVVDTAF